TREGREGEGRRRRGRGRGAERDRAISSAAADIIQLVAGRRFHRQRHRTMTGRETGDWRQLHTHTHTFTHKHTHTHTHTHTQTTQHKQTHTHKQLQHTQTHTQTHTNTNSPPPCRPQRACCLSTAPLASTPRRSSWSRRRMTPG